MVHKANGKLFPPQDYHSDALYHEYQSSQEDENKIHETYHSRPQTEFRLDQLGIFQDNESKMVGLLVPS